MNRMMNQFFIFMAEFAQPILDHFSEVFNKSFTILPVYTIRQ